MKKVAFTTVERLENAIRIFKSDMEIHELDKAFPKPELKVEPKDVMELVINYNKLSECIRQTLVHICEYGKVEIGSLESRRLVDLQALLSGEYKK